MPKNRELRYRLRQVEKDEFFGMSVKNRLKYLDQDIEIGAGGKCTGNMRPYHFVYTQSFSKEMLYYFCGLADAVRELRAEMGRENSLWLKKLLPHKRVIGLFNQASSRTETSFQAAAQNLGIDVLVKNLANSSQKKGESWADTIYTFSVYADALFIRHSEPSRLEEAVWVANQLKKRIPIINAGSGPDNHPNTYQHPTQMLLDIYTLWRSFEDCGGMDNRIWLFSGDLNARVVRSLIYASRHFPPKKIWLNCPVGRDLNSDMVDFLEKRKIPFEYCTSVGDHLDEIDIYYFSRIQDEYDADGSVKSKLLDASHILKWEYAERIKKSARILHALPKRDEIDIAYDFAPDPFHQFVYRSYQMKNGEWMRTAIFAYLFGVDEEILARFKKEAG